MRLYYALAVLYICGDLVTAVVDITNVCHPDNYPDCRGSDEVCVDFVSGDEYVCRCAGPDITFNCTADRSGDDFLSRSLECPTQEEDLNRVCSGENEECAVDPDTFFLYCKSTEIIPETTPEPIPETTDNYTESATYQPTPHSYGYGSNVYSGGDQYYEQIPNVGTYYDAHSIDIHDPFLNATFAGPYEETFIERSCDHEGISCDGSYPYRQHGGVCNNLENPLWGAAFTAQMRMLDPVFEVGTDPSMNVPRQTGLRSPRQLSNELFDATYNQRFSMKHTLTMVWFGQALAHDIALTTQHKEPADCCNETNHFDPNCLPIVIPTNDYYFSEQCMHLTRSEFATRGCLPNSSVPEENYSEIENKQSSYIDLSFIYGNTDDEANNLRNFTDGKLKVKHTAEGLDLLPESSHSCPMTQPDAYCQLAGDVRIDDIPYLGASHLLWVRTHNLVAGNLAEINPGWDDETLYQETRKILIAIFQNVVYKEYLAEMFGPYLHPNNSLSINATGYQDDYDPTSNGGIYNEVIAAPWRHGHSMIAPHQAYLMPNFCLMDWYTTVESFHSSQFLYANDGQNLTEYVRWIVWDAAMDMDRFIEDEFRNFLFYGNGSTGAGGDLGARNIMRGRDHGIGTYNQFRQFCGFAPVTFEDYILEDHDYDSSTGIRQLYNSPDDIDLFVGGLTEKPRGGSILGPTFTCMLIKQFQKIRFSDRFWFERDGMFTEEQLNNIKSVPLSKIVCDAYDLPKVQSNLFRHGAFYGGTNPLVNCTDLPSLDLSLWSER